MEFKTLTIAEIVSLILVFLGLISYMVLLALFYVLYFYIPTIIIGIGFLLFGISKHIEQTRVQNKAKRTHEGILFFHFRPGIISFLSIIIGIAFPLGEFFYQYGEISSILEYWKIGVILRAVNVLVLAILLPITFILSLYYKRKEDHRVILILPELLLSISIFASFFIYLDFLAYDCYLLFQLPSCFSTEFYVITTSLIIFISLYLLKLIYLSQLRKKSSSWVEQEYLENQTKLLLEKNDSLVDDKTTNLWKLIKESFSAETYWTWKINWRYHQRKHSITRFCVTFIVSFPVYFGISLLVFYLVSNS